MNAAFLCNCLPAFIYFYFLLKVSLDFEDLGSISVYQATSCFGQFIFHQEPVLDQTMTNLQQNKIGLKFPDFNPIIFET